MHRLLQARRSGEFDILSRFEDILVNIFAVPVDVVVDAHQLKRIATDTSVENARRHTASMHIRKWFSGL